jgi:hypothetical protein
MNHARATYYSTSGECQRILRAVPPPPPTEWRHTANVGF